MDGNETTGDSLLDHYIAEVHDPIGNVSKTAAKTKARVATLKARDKSIGSAMIKLMDQMKKLPKSDPRHQQLMSSLTKLQKARKNVRNELELRGSSYRHQ